ncbi:MAG: ankyrin repeat domain-containing protein [Wolbachia endosymbiont of Fragariocoptes setiger]|nr:ankyrin repeat domain-containing protein [Wolbachia endosymbiont of Fragariocoptes setiger]
MSLYRNDAKVDTIKFDIATIIEMIQPKDRENINTSLVRAIKEQNIEDVKSAVISGADVNKVYKGKTVLQIACQKDSVEIVSYLLLVGADPKVSDESGRLPIHVSAFLGQLRLVELFKEKGIDFNVQDSCEATPLHYACSEGHLEVVQYLIEHGANLNIKGKNGKTPLHYACSEGHLEIVQYLIEHGANPNIKDNSENTPLELAIAKEQDHIVDYFIKLQNKSPRISITLAICVIACIVIACYIDPLYMGLFCIAGVALVITGTRKSDNKTNVHLSTSIVDPEYCEVNPGLRENLI